MGTCLQSGRSSNRITVIGLILLAAIALSCAGCAASQKREAILLVSLEDGSVIQQTVQLDADICFKTNGVSTTTCLTRGAPIMDQGDGGVIGYEMSPSEIELIAK